MKTVTKYAIGDYIKPFSIIGVGTKYATVKCDCGKIKIMHFKNLHGRRFCSRQCGLKKEVISKLLTTHGCASIRTPEYSTWNAMIQRCTNPNATGYVNYGGRGIKVCDRWRSFELFLADMGYRPSLEYVIDRINNDGNYEPNNCQWITRAANSSKAHKGIHLNRPLFPNGYIKHKAA